VVEAPSPRGLTGAGVQFHPGKLPAASAKATSRGRAKKKKVVPIVSTKEIKKSKSDGDYTFPKDADKIFMKYLDDRDMKSRYYDYKDSRVNGKGGKKTWPQPFADWASR
jgi:hypothetical protein